MRRNLICTLVLTLFAFPLYAQIDSLSNQQASKRVVIVSLDPKSEGRLESIDDSAKPYSLKELIRFPKGFNSVNLGFWIAAMALFVSIFTYIAQKKTEKHTTNAPIEVQLWKLRDLPRHFYRNLVCICAIALNYRAEGAERKRKRYPSESNLRKLQTLPDDIVLPIDVDKKKKPEDNAYKHMHELRLLLRNYNIEVEVASEHLTKKTISDESLKQDFDNLLFKPIHLIQSTFAFEKTLTKSADKHLVIRTIYSVLNEHFKKLKIATNFNLLSSSYSPDYLDALLVDHCSLFNDRIDTKSGIDRSVDNLLGSGYDKVNGKEAYRGITIIEKDEKKYEATISRTAAIKEFGSLNDFVERISCIKNYEAFADFYKDFYLHKEKEMSQEQKDSAYDLYSHMKPYFDYLLEETWDFHILLKYILTIDAIIEIDRIGMVNYA